MIMFKKKIFITCLMFAFGLLPIVFSCLFSFNNPNAYRNAELDCFDKFLDKTNADRLFLNYALKGKDSYFASNKLFLNQYPYNFSNNTTILLTILDNNQPAKYDVFVNGNESVSFSTSVVSGVNYTNQKELSRFETCCINLYRFRERSDELYYDKNLYDGFIYIPDYFADFIIENNDEIFTYDDLIFDKDNKWSIRLRHNQIEYKYKIANIFRVNDFKKDYSTIDDFKYNDYATGRFLDKYFNGFCFVSNYSRMTGEESNLAFSNLYMSLPKKFVIEDFLKVADALIGDTNVEKVPIIDSFSNNSTVLTRYKRTMDLVKCYEKHELSSKYYSLIIFTFVSLVIYLGFVGILRTMCMRPFVCKLLFANSSIFMAFLVTSFVLRRIAYFDSLGGLILFSEFSNLIITILLISTIVFLLCSLKKYEK